MLCIAAVFLPQANKCTIAFLTLALRLVARHVPLNFSLFHLRKRFLPTVTNPTVLHHHANQALLLLLSARIPGTGDHVCQK